MKYFLEFGCYFLIFALLHTGSTTSSSIETSFTNARETNSLKSLWRAIYRRPFEMGTKEGNPHHFICFAPGDDHCSKHEVYWVKEDFDGGIKPFNDSRLTVDPNCTLWFSNVTESDVTDTFAYACVVFTSENEYTVGRRLYLHVYSDDAMVRPNKREPVKQYVSKTQEVALRGNEIELFCIYGGSPLPVTIWRKDGQRIEPSDRIKEKNYGKSLLIENVNFDDKGVYTCDVSNGVGAAQSYSIDLEVQDNDDKSVA